MDTTFSSSSLYLSAFLKCKGLKLEAVKRNEVRQVFVFKDIPERPFLADAFLLGKSDSVSAKEYMQALKDLKALMYDR